MNEQQADVIRQLSSLAREIVDVQAGTLSREDYMDHADKVERAALEAFPMDEKAAG
jgi:hypothetical protein